MEQIKRYEELLNNVENIVSSSLYPEACQQMQEEKNAIIQRLEKEKGIKVPIVGNFNSGKSSLLNSLLGRGEILPTNIEAETSIPYELYPMVENEHVELYRNGNLISNVKLDSIKKLSIAPGDVAHVFINNTFVRDLATKGIILVDMPGLDSGIKEHNDAIIHYINNGTAFALLADIETGALTKTTISFIKELLSYDLSPSVFLSKADQKEDSERKSIVNYVRSQINTEIEQELYLGVISAADNNIEDFTNYLSQLDPDSLIAKKYKNSIIQFLNHQIKSINTQISLLSIDFDDEEAQKRINELEQKKTEIEEKLSGDIDNADTPEKSTMDILDEVKDALSVNANQIATSIVKKESSDDVNAQLLSILKPVIVKAFQREGGEYAAALNSVVDDISKALQNALNISDGLINSVVEEYKEDIQNIISLAADALRNSDNPYAQIFAQILDFFGEDIPDFIRWIFGRSEEDKIAEATSRINTTMYSALQRNLYPTLLEQVRGQQERIKAKVIEQVKIQIAQIEEAIKAILRERKKAEEALNKRKEQLLEILSSLNEIKEKLSK